MELRVGRTSRLLPSKANQLTVICILHPQKRQTRSNHTRPSHGCNAAELRKSSHATYCCIYLPGVVSQNQYLVTITSNSGRLLVRQLTGLRDMYSVVDRASFCPIYIPYYSTAVKSHGSGRVHQRAFTHSAILRT